MEELLRKLLIDYKKRPSSVKKIYILEVLKYCPVYTIKGNFMTTLEIKENKKYKHYFPVYTMPTSNDEYEEKSKFDIVKFIEQNNIYNDYKIDGIIVDPNEAAITCMPDDLAIDNYDRDSLLKEITWLKPRPLLKIDEAIYNCLSKFNNTLNEETKFNFRTNDEFVNLDINPGELVIIGGRPSMGKSQVAVSLVCNETINNNGSVIYFSNELPIERLTQKIINQLSHSGILRDCKTSDENYTRMVAGSKRIKNKNIYLQDSIAFDIKEYEKIIKKNINKIKPTMIIIDYFQLIEINNKFMSPSRYKHIIGILNEIAKKYNVKMIVLYTLSRALEHRKDKHPRLSDIWGSPIIGEIADKVYMLYRDGYYHENYDENEDKLEITKLKPSNEQHTDVYTLVKGLEGGYIR